MVSALLSRGSVNVAMPPETVTVVVPWSGPEPSGSDAAVTCVAVVAGLQIAVLVFNVDHGLRAEGHARRRRRRRLGAHRQLTGRRGADHDVVGRRRR